MKLSWGNKSPEGLRSWNHPADGRTDGQTAAPEDQDAAVWTHLAAPDTAEHPAPGAGVPCDPADPKGQRCCRCGQDMQAEFGSSLKLSRKLLAETKILMQLFVSERLADVQLPFLPMARLLPHMSQRPQQWLGLSAPVRLREMQLGLFQFRAYVEVLRLREQERGAPGLAQRLQEIGLDLRDLSHHIDYQMCGSGQPTPLTPTPPHALQHVSEWNNLQESYLLLRALETFLGRAVRDFTLLRMGATWAPR